MCMCVTTSELGVLLSMRSDLYERHVRLGRVKRSMPESRSARVALTGERLQRCLTRY